MLKKIMLSLVPFLLVSCDGVDRILMPARTEPLITTTPISTNQLVKSATHINFHKYQNLAVVLVSGSGVGRDLHQLYIIDALKQFKLFNTITNLAPLHDNEGKVNHFLVMEFNISDTNANVHRYSVKVYDPAFKIIFFSAQHTKKESLEGLTEQDAWDPLLNVVTEWLRTCAANPPKPIVIKAPPRLLPEQSARYL